MEKRKSTAKKFSASPVAIESLTISHVLKVLKPTHIWTILGIIFSLLSGAFLLGYHLKSNIAEADLNRERASAETRISALQADKLKTQNESEAKTRELNLQIEAMRPGSKRFQFLQAKEQFLTFLSRYLLSKQAATDLLTNSKLQEQKENDLQKLTAFIDELVTKASESRDEQAAMYIGRGESVETSKIIFAYDDTSWSIPKEALRRAIKFRAAGGPN